MNNHKPANQDVDVDIEAAPALLALSGLFLLILLRLLRINARTRDHLRQLADLYQQQGH